MLEFLKYKQEFNLDDPQATLFHRKIILEKPFLKKLYTDWYKELMKAACVQEKGNVLEIGSGGGFIKELYPNVITSDILPLETCDQVFSAEEIPFGNNSLSAILMLNVFHHIPHPWKFLQEAERTLMVGGRIVMIEPANTLISRFIYKRFHHEPFDEKGSWEIDSKGPLSDSNQALPYIYFERDKDKFDQHFPRLTIKNITYHTPLRYLISGGVSFKTIFPLWSYPLFKSLEQLFSPFHRYTALFARIVIEKNQKQ